MTIVPERLRALHSRAPERVAVHLQVAGREYLPVTYDQLLRGAGAFARTLAREAIQPGEVVVLILQHSEELLYSFWGSILHGAIPGTESSSRTCALRTGPGGNDPQRMRGSDKAQRRDIDRELHLHYWECADGTVELASVVYHNDFSIPG